MDSVIRGFVARSLYFDAATDESVVYIAANGKCVCWRMLARSRFTAMVRSLGAIILGVVMKPCDCVWECATIFHWLTDPGLRIIKIPTFSELLDLDLHLNQHFHTSSLSCYCCRIFTVINCIKLEFDKQYENVNIHLQE